MTVHQPLVCTCGPQPVTLRLGAYCLECHAHVDDSEPEEPEPYLGPQGYDKARDSWEQEQEDHAAHQAR
jgi:hypothetical protein